MTQSVTFLLARQAARLLPSQHPGTSASWRTQALPAVLQLCVLHREYSFCPAIRAVHGAKEIHRTDAQSPICPSAIYLHKGLVGVWHCSPWDSYAPLKTWLKPSKKPVINGSADSQQRTERDRSSKETWLYIRAELSPQWGRI